MSLHKLFRPVDLPGGLLPALGSANQAISSLTPEESPELPRTGVGSKRRMHSGMFAERTAPVQTHRSAPQVGRGRNEGEEFCGLRDRLDIVSMPARPVRRRKQ